ncbi:LysR family transcriptional regulator [Photobacterium lutimaris]|uniref:LysR family transcriptional regulator n=1 Tax=Photobacterium lutimaris TaxID=388278 RepID=A0A2T3J465_9GAMM|nr:LysR family transcriptional regulator [Photobacterium lutimaris]PSU36092.1 LysR family transcriptional regulator [Photobacterium lutimaris]TDR79196.1 DNA-binding transcriptional LysR family regulator [Photobacterium lutimaris]
MFNNMDLNLLKVFVAVYRHRSITLAAEEIGMTQPGVSGLLKRLHHQLDVQLFVRSGRGIVPTHQARELMRQVEPALIQIQNALEGIESFSTDHDRRFVIYASEPAMLMLLPKIEADDSLGNVKIELHPTFSSEEKLINSLNQQRVDLAIDFANYSAPSFLFEHLFEDELCIIVRKHHPRIDDAISLEQYYQEKHITLKLRREDAYLADYFTEESLDERHIAAECDSLLSQMSMISNSDCVAVMSRRLARMFAEKLDIKMLEAPFTSIPIRYRIMTHNRMKQSPSNQWLRQKLKSYFPHSE